jgi:hypothetical protein
MGTKDQPTWPEGPDMGAELGTDETCVDYLVGQFRSVLGQELVVKETTSTTTTRPTCPLPPLEPLPTVRSGPPREMVFISTTTRTDVTVRTGPPTHMPPPPVEKLVRRKRRLPSPAVLPPVGQPHAPHDLIPTVVLRRPKARWPDLATDATTRRRLVETDTEPYLPPRTEEHVPLPHRGLTASRSYSATVSGWEQPYASLEIEITGSALSRRRGWPRLVTSAGLAALILALSGCTAYLLGLLE